MSASTHRDVLKVHRREVRVGPRAFQVLTLRAATRVRFSSNYFHDTHHILTGPAGVRLLAQLFWALSYQRVPHTLFVIDGEHLVPTPFEADPALPIAIVPEALTHVDDATLRQVRARMPKASDGTVRLTCSDLAERARTQDWRALRRLDPQRGRERMSERGGFRCYTAPPDILRAEALALQCMGTYNGSGYHYLAHRGTWSRAPDGEVQVLDAFDDMCASAEVARAEVRPRGLVADDGEKRAIYEAADNARARRQRARALRRTEEGAR
ncbi:MAG: hypothetical protein HOO96_33260 [Polyangiaceae bacterium]|nr:hypothetical protein [Polyangiaceae bacterium]